MRLDLYLLNNNLVNTRSKSIYFIKSGKIIVNNKVVLKPSFEVTNSDIIKLVPKFIYVSKGGYKLETFLNKISFSVKNKTILDIGCSTGGFTNYFLTHGAKEVFAVDIAENILSKDLYNNKNLVYQDKFDATDKNKISMILNSKKLDIISIDVSDRSIRDILLNLSYFLKTSGSIIALFKPHYEGKKGIVSKEDKDKLISDFENWLYSNTPYKIIHKLNSSERGGYNLKGNREIFLILKLKSHNYKKDGHL